MSWRKGNDSFVLLKLRDGPPVFRWAAESCEGYISAPGQLLKLFRIAIPLNGNFGRSNVDFTQIIETQFDGDGTENKENYGANAILAVSLAAAKAAANADRVNP